MKQCCRCKELKPETNFSKFKKNKNGLNNACKACINSWKRNYSLAHPEKIKEANKKWYAAKGRKYHLERKYGIRVEDVPQSCQVCGSRKRICVDHNHETGIVRGFLCNRCNVVLGKVRDNPSLLEKLALYLREKVSV